MLRIIACLGLALTFGLPAPLQAAEVKLSTGDTWLPFTDMNAKGGGLATEIVVRVFEEMGDQPKVDYLPWARSYELARRNQYIGTFPWYNSDERLRDMLYSAPLFNTKTVVFTRREGDAQPASWEESPQGSLCLPAGYTVFPQIQERVDDGSIKMFRPPSLENCLRMLSGDRTDYVIAAQLVGRATIRSEKLDEALFSELETPIEESPLFFLVPRDAPNAETLMKSFNDQLEKLQQSGEIDKILGL